MNHQLKFLSLTAAVLSNFASTAQSTPMNVSQVLIENKVHGTAMRIGMKTVMINEATGELQIEPAWQAKCELTDGTPSANWAPANTDSQLTVIALDNSYKDEDIGPADESTGNRYTLTSQLEGITMTFFPAGDPSNLDPSTVEGLVIETEDIATA